jgi:hypothetical protein
MINWHCRFCPVQPLKSKVAAAVVLTCGDTYHGNGIDHADSPRWKTEYEDIYTNPSLHIPWHPSLGNHDNRGKVQAEIEYSDEVEGQGKVENPAIRAVWPDPSGT